MSEFKDGLNLDNYSEVRNLDDFNLTDDYFDNMNQDSSYVLQRHEANLLILGNLAEDLLTLKDKEMIDDTMIGEITNFLFVVVSEPSSDVNSGILIGRALWCISKLLSLVRDNLTICTKIFEAISTALCNPNSDLSVTLVACLCLNKICYYFKTQTFESEYIVKDYEVLINILRSTTDETIIIPVDAILALSKVNKEKSLFVPRHYLKFIIDIYSKYYNDSYIGGKILSLIKLWCHDSDIAKLLMNLFIPFAIHVFDDLFRSLKNPNDNKYEDIKKTVITEVGGDVNFNANQEMLPV